MKPDTSLRVVVPLLFALSIGWTLQAEEPPHSSIGGEVTHGGNLAMAKAGGDTINLMASHNDPTNGPGEPLYYGDFEDPSGNPAWNGWTHRDLTRPEDGFWSVSNYNQPDIQNHAAWCGDIAIPSCDGGMNDPDGGYGNGWHSILEFRQAVPYPSVETSVTVTATLIHDTEPGYDYTYLSYQFEGESHLNIQSWDGNGTVSVYGGVTYLPHVSFGASMPAESLTEAMTLYSDIVRRPHLPADQLDDARMMAMQELRATEDEPTQRVMRRLRELHYGERVGRSNLGTAESLTAISQDDVRDFYTTHYHAGGAIIAIAGNVNPDEIFDSKEAEQS